MKPPISRVVKQDPEDREKVKFLETTMMHE